MSKFLKIEKELAELLGYTLVHHWPNGLLTGKPETYHTVINLPHWTQDNAACFELMCEHDINVDMLTTFVITCNNSSSVLLNASVNYKDYANKQEAMRMAICLAVIAKLKEN